MWIFCLILMICCLGLLIKMGIQKKQINRIKNQIDFLCSRDTGQQIKKIMRCSKTRLQAFHMIFVHLLQRQMDIFNYLWNKTCCRNKRSMLK